MPSQLPKLSLLDRAVCAVSPAAGMRRLAAKRILHEYRYEGAEMSTKRASAPQNMSPNSFDVQRDRLQLMREAEDLERNFAPAKMLNRKFALNVAPVSYHAQTGDPVLDREVEDYLNDEAFSSCDVTGRYGFLKMLEFGVMGCNRGGDYGWAFMRPGLEEGMSEEDAVKLPLKIQAVEPDRIGGIYQNVVSNDYVSGLLIGEYGEVTHYRVFHRSMTTNVYDNPVDVPAANFVHYTDPLRIDQYRGVSILATAVQNLRDLYECIDFVKGKMKLASALTVFSNGVGATSGTGSMDAYSTEIGTSGAQGLQQDIYYGQVNHVGQGEIKFPTNNSPSTDERELMTLLLKLVAMSYNLPYSFALDASALGGVSSRLESEQAKQEFERARANLSPHASRMKNALLMDAVAKGIFPVSVMRKIVKGRWGYRPHPQPDIGREATAAVSLYEHGMQDPIQFWIDNGQDPEAVAANMVRWATIKEKAVQGTDLKVEDVFGSGPQKPVSATESTSQSVQTDQTTATEYSRNERHDFASDDQPRNEDGKFAGNGGGATKNKPKENRKITISQAAKGLDEIGVTLGRPDPWKPGDTETTYNLTDRNTGETFKKTARQIIDALNSGKRFSAHYFSRKNYRESDSSINQRIADERENVAFGKDWIDDITETIATLEKKGDSEGVQKARIELDKAKAYLVAHEDALSKLNERRQRRDTQKPTSTPATKPKKPAATDRQDWHALVEALKQDAGLTQQQAEAAAYHIISSGHFNRGKLPPNIKDKYFQKKGTRK